MLKLKENVGESLNKGLAALENANPELLEGVLRHIDFNATKGRTKLKDEQLVNNFNQYKLTTDNFEFPDLLGAAYEYLLKQFVDSAGATKIRVSIFTLPSPSFACAEICFLERVFEILYQIVFGELVANLNCIFDGNSLGTAVRFD